ncbi:hypothetical protein GCM10027037_12940 [Mucilaginibacter koreensis]
MSEIKLHIAEHFDAPVWRMEVDSLTNMLFAELRDVTNRRVSFASINLDSAKTNFKNYKTEEAWLTGMESAYNGVLLIHYYETQQGPAHKGLAAIDGVSGELLWSNFSYGFDHLNTNGPVLYDARLQPRKYFLADVFSGTGSSAIDVKTDEPLENFIELPASLLASAVTELMTIQVETYGNIVQCLDYNSYRIVSLHTQWAGQLKQLLYIFENGKPVFEDFLNADIQKMQPEAFVLYKHQLIYLKNKTELKVLNL